MSCEEIVPPINTVRLRLDGLGPGDVGALRELDTDPLARRFIDGGRPNLPFSDPSELLNGLNFSPRS